MKGTMSKERIYADGVENVSLVEGMVRVDLFHYGMRVEGMTVTPHEVTQQLVLPPARFYGRSNRCSALWQSWRGRGW